MAIQLNLENWQQNGFLVLHEFFEQRDVSRVNLLIDSLWEDHHKSNAATIIDSYPEPGRHQRLLFSSAGNSVRQHPYKLNDLYLDQPDVRDIILDPRLCRILAQLIDGDPLVCNSLNLEFGSEQGLHIDSMFMTPRVMNKLVVSWIALDEITEENGPLVYYPGSHLIPPYHFSNGGISAIDDELDAFNCYISTSMEERGIEPIRFLAHPGDVLIWHAQLAHAGGTIQNSSLTRRSMVTHYFRKQDYRHHFWRIRKQHAHGYYLKRRHPGVS